MSDFTYHFFDSQEDLDKMTPEEREEALARQRRRELRTRVNTLIAEQLLGEKVITQRVLTGYKSRKAVNPDEEYDPLDMVPIFADIPCIVAAMDGELPVFAFENYGEGDFHLRIHHLPNYLSSSSRLERVMIYFKRKYPDALIMLNYCPTDHKWSCSVGDQEGSFSSDDMQVALVRAIAQFIDPTIPTEGPDDSDD